MTPQDTDRLARIRAGMAGRARYEGREERDGEFLLRLLDEAEEALASPEIADFLRGVTLEAAHQRARWGEAHDRSKSAENWYWLIGYLAGKALRAAIDGNRDKARHHTISAAAALYQWHQAISGDLTNCGSGADADLTAALVEQKP